MKMVLLKTDAAPFAEGDTFEITVSATGYLPQSFTYTTKVAPAPAEVNTATLEATIAKAEGLKEADYTADSWKAMQAELALLPKQPLRQKNPRMQLTPQPQAFRLPWMH